jgi:hypothetical protein
VKNAVKNDVKNDVKNAVKKAVSSIEEDSDLNRRVGICRRI